MTKNKLEDQKQSKLTLTAREQNCLAHVIATKSIPEIAHILNLSEHTVIFYLTNFMTRMHRMISIQSNVKNNKPFE